MQATTRELGSGRRLAGLVRLPTSKRLPVAAGLFALIAVLATPALGVGGRVRDLFEGTPPTPLVQQHFSLLSPMIERQNQEAAAQALPAHGQVDSSKVHGLLAVAAGGHQVNLWVAPMTDGNTLWWLIQIDGEADPGNTLYGPSGSFAANSPETEGNIAWTEFANANLQALRILVGQVFTDASTLTVELASGASLRVPVVEHFFLALLDQDATTASISAYDASGEQTAHSTRGMVIH